MPLIITTIDEVLEAMALASSTLYEVLGLGRQVLGLGLGPQVLYNGCCILTLLFVIFQ